jgi:hypothetical protein
MKGMRARTGLWAFLGVFWALWGCGYTTDTLWRSDIRTVYVPVFENETFRRGLEVELTKAVVDEINMRTRMRVVGREGADSMLTGRVRDLKETVVTKTEADVILEKQVTVYVSFEWVDLRTGQTLGAANDVEVAADLVFPAGETLDSSTGRAFGKAARKIVELMESEW